MRIKHFFCIVSLSFGLNAMAPQAPMSSSVNHDRTTHRHLYEEDWSCFPCHLLQLDPTMGLDRCAALDRMIKESVDYGPNLAGAMGDLAKAFYAWYRVYLAQYEESGGVVGNLQTAGYLFIFLAKIMEVLFNNVIDLQAELDACESAVQRVFNTQMRCDEYARVRELAQAARNEFTQPGVVESVRGLFEPSL